MDRITLGISYNILVDTGHLLGDIELSLNYEGKRMGGSIGRSTEKRGNITKEGV
jgi:hypothetical protein